MTSENELLPLPEPDGAMEIRVAGMSAEIDSFRASTMIAYALANMWPLRAEVAELQFQLKMLACNYEQATAYTVAHRGRLLYCDSSMRDAYSDEHHRAERLAEALRTYGQHDETCGVYAFGNSRCTCGFSAALQGQEEQK